MLSRLQASDLRPFMGLCPPSLRSSFTSGSVPPGYFLLGAFREGRAAGLLVGDCGQHAEHPHLRSIAISPRYRRLGLGTVLLRSFERDMMLHGYGRINIIHRSASSEISNSLQGFLRKAGWPALHPTSLLCRTDFPTLSQAPWMTPRRLSAEFEYVALGDICRAERDSMLLRQRTAAFFPEDLNPFVAEEEIAWPASFALRYRGSVVGWCVLREVDAVTLSCSSLFVEERFQRLGRAIDLLARCLQSQRHTAKQEYFFDVKLSRPSMVQFVQGRMRPFLKEVSWLSRASKMLANERTKIEIPLSVFMPKAEVSPQGFGRA